MPIVTKIEQQRKRKDRYSIFVDGQYSFSLSEVDLAASGVRKGRELSGSELRELIDMSGSSKLYDKAIHYLSFRPRSVKEVADHLAKKGHDCAEVEPVIQKLLEQKLLDDEAFARSWTESRSLLKPSSKKKLTLELRQKGVPADIVERVLDELDSGDEVEAIKKLAQKKLSLARYQDQRKLTDYLLRQGFSYDAVKTALNEI